MSTFEDSISAEQLPERQRAFVEKLRRHDKRVKVFREASGLKFQGPVIGEGPLPPAEPEVSEPGNADEGS
jgi:hypothetical protein